jgi:hypothetical protein
LRRSSGLGKGRGRDGEQPGQTKKQSAHFYLLCETEPPKWEADGKRR